MFRSLAVLGAALATAAVVAETASAAGGLSVSPSRLEATARTGASGSVTVTNSSTRKLRVTVRARPWRQLSNGIVAANRSRSLGLVRVSPSRFTLAPGTSRSVFARLRRVPPRRSLYGALDILGKPAKRRSGINVAYRLVPSLRFNPTAGRRKLRLSAGRAGTTGSGSSRMLTLKVKNRGNTVDQVGGTVSITGPGGGRSGGISPKSIVPGKTSKLRVLSLSGMRKGRYTAAITLAQAGRNIVSVTRSFRIR
jgi:P pilus assembly chaperone PapD